MTSTTVPNNATQGAFGEYEKMVDKASKFLKAKPNATLSEFFDQYLKHMIENVRGDVAELADRVDEVEAAVAPAELEILDQMSECLVETSTFVDKLLISGGYLIIDGDKREFTPKFDEIKEDFAELAETWEDMNEAIEEHRAAYEDDPEPNGGEAAPKPQSA